MKLQRVIRFTKRGLALKEIALQPRFLVRVSESSGHLRVRKKPHVAQPGEVPFSEADRVQEVDGLLLAPISREDAERRQIRPPATEERKTAHVQEMAVEGLQLFVRIEDGAQVGAAAIVSTPQIRVPSLSQYELARHLGKTASIEQLENLVYPSRASYFFLV